MHLHTFVVQRVMYIFYSHLTTIFGRFEVRYGGFIPPPPPCTMCCVCVLESQIVVILCGCESVPVATIAKLYVRESERVRESFAFFSFIWLLLYRASLRQATDLNTFGFQRALSAVTAHTQGYCSFNFLFVVLYLEVVMAVAMNRTRLSARPRVLK